MFACALYRYICIIVYVYTCECATHKCHSAIIACIHIIACIINYNYCVIEDEVLKREEGEEEEKEKEEEEELFQLPSDGLISLSASSQSSHWLIVTFTLEPEFTKSA